MKYHGNEYFVAVWCNEFFFWQCRQLASMEKKLLGVFSHSRLRLVDFAGYEPGENFLFEDRDIC